MQSRTASRRDFTLGVIALLFAGMRSFRDPWTVGALAAGVVLMSVALVRLYRDVARKHSVERELQDSEAKYRLLMEQAADAIIIMNSAATCVEVNARAAEIAGRSPEEMRGLPLAGIVQGNDPKSPANLPMLRYGQVTTGEFWIARPDGSRVPVEIRATLLEDGRVQIIARDITERKEVDRLKDQFVSMVSHELRTPLTSIRGALGLLATEKLRDEPEKQRRMLQLAATNTDRLIRLINDILDVERISSEGATYAPSAQSAVALVARAVETLQPAAEREGVVLEWTGDPLDVWADPDRMEQALTNLVGNAIKFSARGSHVRVVVKRDGRFALFEVHDRGRGIPRDKLESIFGRFQQVDASDSRAKGGTGLGLAITRAIVQQHGGRVWAESDLGHGSVFRFTIPLSRGAKAAVVEASTG